MQNNLEFIPELKKADSENERKSFQEMSRREFLEGLSKVAMVLGLGGFEAVLSSGCAVKKMGLENAEINQGLDKFNHGPEDPNGYLKYLEEREFIIKNAIFDSYARTVDKRPEWMGDPVGGYASENFLDKKEEVEEFRQRLVKVGLTTEEIKFYESLFTSSDIIIFRESILKDKSFLQVLPHERFHKAMKRLSIEDYKIMRQASLDIIEKRDKDNRRLVSEKYYEGKNTVGFYVAAASMNWEEFYTHLAQGVFDDSAEQFLKADYPEAYEIFNRIREDCRLKEKK